MTCDSVKCANEAMFRALWPGREAPRFCGPCTARAVWIADAMGFCLQVELLPGKREHEEARAAERALQGVV